MKDITPPQASTNAKQGVPRQRKAHRKSRLGCANCKLRGVKCDEAKPSCKRCGASGFSCDYSRSGSAASALQLTQPGGGFFSSSFSINPSSRIMSRNSRNVSAHGKTPYSLSPPQGLPAPNPQKRVPVALPLHGTEGVYELTGADFDALDRFRRRTVFTLGSDRTRPYFVTWTSRLGHSSPYLTHLLITMALIHDTALHAGPQPSTHRAALAFHWYHGTVLFKRKLLQVQQQQQKQHPQESQQCDDDPTLSDADRDTLWAASALLGAAACGHLDSDEPARAWPLRPAEDADLDWLRMSDGKKAVWEIVNPTRDGGAFGPLVAELTECPPPDGALPILRGVLPEPFYSLFDLDHDASSSSPTTNPYRIPCSIIAQLLPDIPSSHNLLRFLSFVSQISASFKYLLQEKDPRALLLLSWWYCKTAVSESWWLRRRSLVEGKAICLLLEKRYGPGKPEYDPRIVELLEYPMSVFDTVRIRGVAV